MEEARFTLKDRDLLIRLDERLGLMQGQLDALVEGISSGNLPRCLVNNERISSLETTRKRLIGSTLTIVGSLVVLSAERLWSLIKAVLVHVSTTAP